MGLTSRVKKQTSSLNLSNSRSPSVEAQEKALQKLHSREDDSNEKCKKIRVSVDVPDELYQIMKKDTKRKGQTLRGFIVSQIADYYEYDGEY